MLLSGRPEFFFDIVLARLAATGCSRRLTHAGLLCHIQRARITDQKVPIMWSADAGHIAGEMSAVVNLYGLLLGIVVEAHSRRGCSWSGSAAALTRVRAFVAAASKQIRSLGRQRKFTGKFNGAGLRADFSVAKPMTTVHQTHKSAARILPTAVSPGPAAILSRRLRP